MTDTVLSVLVLASIALVIGAVAWWRRGQRKQALLMALLALVIAGNVAVWVVPDANGVAPVRSELR
ncbi:MAG: hypothetical protein HOO94_11250 [Novosphingobium sp.]|uniref:hypothetical protein n=1 Tax=Novosphingobium sp. TaxID=1874826 RepID=UPI0017CE85FB|nr:hypothetical protein [Novosphingobium sp.]